MSLLDLYPTQSSGPPEALVNTGTIFPLVDKVAQDVNVLGGTITGTFTGTFTPKGLSTDFIITTENVTDVAAVMPAGGNLTARNAMAIRNLDATETIYLGKIGVTADQAVGTTAGWEVGAGETFQIDITDAITLYARAETGKTVKIKIFEVA